MAHPRSETQRSHASIHAADQAAPDVEHERLEAFVGRWHMEGRQLAGPVGPGATIDALQTYEWLPGGQFLIHRLDGRIGDAPAACVEIIGFEPERRYYRAHTFYHNGQTNVWDIEHRNGRWLAFGDWTAGERCLKLRCTTTFDDDGKTMHGKWEHSTDGLSWQTFWEVSARKVIAS